MKLQLLFTERQFELNFESEPLWFNMADVCLELLLDNPFLFDALKSETYDWEVNDSYYR